MRIAPRWKRATNLASIPSAQPLMVDNHRILQWAPHVGRLVQNSWATLFSAFVISPALLQLSVHWAMLPFCLWILLVALKIDWALLDRLATPPLTILVLAPAIGMGVGVPMYVASLDEEFIPACLIMQLVFVFGTPFLFMGYRLGRGQILAHWCPARTEGIFDSVAKPVMALAVFFLLFDLARITIGWRTGGLDRGYAGEAVIGRDIGIWTFTAIFSRWNNLWFFFLPILWRKGGLALRSFLVFSLCFYSLIAFASGSRGLLLYPVIFLACGLYFFIDKPHFRLEPWAPVLLLCFVAYIYAVDVFRNTTQFQESRLSDLSTRLAATKGIAARASERQDFSFTTGRALVGVADAIIYDMTPNPIPYAGARDILPAILWTWVPQTLVPSKPLLFDGDEIVISYTNNRQERSFSTISFSADLYRRFGWSGIPFGLFLLGAVYGYLIRGIFYIFRSVSVVAGVTLVAFLVGGLQTGFLSTVLTTWWIWAYDLPKHLIPLAVIVFIVGGRLDRGLDSYSGVFGPRRAIMSGGPSGLVRARAKR